MPASSSLQWLETQGYFPTRVTLVGQRRPSQDGTAGGPSLPAGGPARDRGGRCRRVSGEHCCSPLPSEPCVPLVAAHGSSKPRGRFRFAVLGSCLGGRGARGGRRRGRGGFGHRPVSLVPRGAGGSWRLSPAG